MTEQLISFDTAILAKKKGFQVPCNEYSNIVEPDRVITVAEFNFNNIRHGNITVSRPRQSLLQKWIREKHNIHVQAMYSPRKEIMGYFYGIIEHPEAENKEVYDTWEEALEAGLQETLKLIKT